jgi:phage pi2 protein 07
MIVNQIIGAALRQMEDADYENYGRVYIGGEMILIDKDEFNELREQADCEIGFEFEDIVNIKEL